MSKIKYFNENILVKKKSIILRLDFNVPIQNNLIQDSTRIDLAIPLIKELIEKKSKVIILSHLGRPNGTVDKSFSLKPVYNYLRNKLGSKIHFLNFKDNSEFKDKISKIDYGNIILLENIRFFKEETEDDKTFAKKLSALGNIYINDAFSCSHRKQASIHKITDFLEETYAGPLMKKEIEAIDMIVKKPKGPVTCIIGGSKISTKIGVISSLMNKVNNIIIVGAMANNFLSFKGFEIGKSVREENTSQIIENIYREASKRNCKILIPLDCNTAINPKENAKYKEIKQVGKEDMILDIGPKTIDLIEKLIDNSNTILWNGPAGYFENDNFSSGTTSIAFKISKNTVSKNLLSVIGGGDTISAINKTKMKLTFTHLSTAGGAFLEYLEGKDLPGISVLK